MRFPVWQFPLLAALLAGPASADFFFSTGSPDGKMAAVSQPSTAGKLEIETGDDFTLSSPTAISSATFLGLLTGNASVGEVRVEIYRVFPNDSDVGRTSGPPTFSTAQVPTRVNSPSDVEFADRDTASGNLSFTASVLSGGFTALNSVQPGGIHPKPSQTTGGDGSLTGKEVQFDVTFTTPFGLPAGHYFFVPQVEVADASGNFFWLSAPRPILPPGTPFPLGVTDLQAWTRDENLAPDWLRVGTDIVGGSPAPTFDMTFSVTGEAIPEPSSNILLGLALLAIAGIGRKKLLRG
jgi:hypothetical protein